MKNTNKKSKKTRVAVSSTATKKEYKQYQEELNIKNSKFKNFSKFFLVIMIILVAVILIFFSGVFNVKEIIVEKNNLVSDEQVISFSGIQYGKNIFSISKKNIINHLKENSYIGDATVKRIFPDKIKLMIDERNIDFVLQLANSYVYIDRQGYVLEISNNKPNVPMILGFTTDLSNIKPNDRLEEKDLIKMNMVIKIMETANNHNLENLITRIDISNEENYTIYLDSNLNKIAYLGNGSDLNTRFLYIKAILKEQEGKSGEIFVNVDLNSEYVFFREENI